jgi:transcriptional regulator with XRE-family HTH domain
MGGKSQALGERIRAARERLGRNRNQLARELGTSWQHVGRWEDGLTEPSPESLRRIAAFLDVSVDYLLTGSEFVTRAEPAGEGLGDFLRSYAPADISEAEVAWLRAAPIDHAGATPGEYVNMLHALRAGAGPGSTARAPRVKSGRQRKVDWGDIAIELDRAASSRGQKKP